jgi:methyl-accepting chemotaxis protein
MKWFYDLKLATKLVTSFTVVLMLTVILGVFSIMQLANVNSSTNAIATNWMPSSQSALEIKASLARYRYLLLQHILSIDEKEMQHYQEQRRRGKGVAGRLRQVVAALRGGKCQGRGAVE